MAKTKISEFDSIPANNTDIDSINIAEGCAPSGINNAIRELMAQLKDQQIGASGDSFSIGGNLYVAGTSTFVGIPTGPTASFATNTTQLATTAFVLANSNPTGGIMMWSTGTAPTGWLLCAGAAVSRSTYAALFAVIGTTFGAGDGTTTFNLPNYTNRFPYGTTVASTGGSADAVIVSHSHTATVTDPTHAHATGRFLGTLGGFNTAYVGDDSGAGPASNGTTIAAATGISVTNASTGVSGTNANLPPYLGINFIIKT
jgi:microcystin-dependent protein